MRLLILITFILGSSEVISQVQPKNVVIHSIRLDTIRIVIPKAEGQNALNIRLHNYKMKTPMYNSILTGTSAAGDVNTGISMNYAVNNTPETPAAQRIRLARDSANKKSEGIDPQHN